MQKPVIVRANYKVSTSLTVTLENLLGANLPLMSPDILLINRTPTSCNVAVSGLRRLVFLSQSDQDFDGTVTAPIFTTFTMGPGVVQKITGVDQSGLLGAPYGQTFDLTFTNAGPAAAVWLSLIIKGVIETAVSPDPLLVVNV